MGLMAKSLRLWTAACIFFFAAVGVALPEERQFADDNCSVTFPDTWHEITKKLSVPGLLVAFSDATGKKIVYLQRIPGKPSGPLNDRYIAEMEKGIEETGGGEKLSGKYIEVAGIKSYERLGIVPVRGRNVSTMSWFVPGENNYYNIQALRFEGDASQDTEIRQVFDSFRFLHPFVPTYAPNLDSAAYQIGKGIGALGVLVVVVSFLGYAVSSSLRRRPASLPPRPPPSAPPPLPPGVH